VEEILLEIYKEVRRKYQDNTENGHLLTAVCSGIGEFYLDLKYDGAEKFLLEAFNLRANLYGTEKAFLLANTMNRLGILYAQMGEYRKAEIMFEDACRILKELYEQNREFEPDYAMALANLGTFYYETFRPEDALKYLGEAVKHGHVLPCGGAVPYFNMALCYQDLNDSEKAAEFYARALVTLSGAGVRMLLYLLVKLWRL
jgi:tetratricopeptide (TPR) repeat protein